MASDVEQAGIRASTYRNYVHAYSIYCQHKGYTSAAHIADQHSALPWSQNAQANGMLSDDLRRHLFRGWLTLDTLSSLPIDSQPDLAIGASMWLPVQAYYACHGVGLAALCALGAQMPSPAEHTHRKFLNIASVNIVQSGLLLPPWSIHCTGDCTQDGDEQFHGTQVTPAEVIATHNLSAPGTPEHAELLIAKALKTTRRAVLEERQQQTRRQKHKKRLSQAQKQTICNNTEHTTCFDFLYRMRICSNYEDADLFLFGQGQDAALDHCTRVIWLADSICTQLNCAIRRKLGAATYQQLLDQYAQHH